MKKQAVEKRKGKKLRLKKNNRSISVNSVKEKTHLLLKQLSITRSLNTRFHYSLTKFILFHLKRTMTLPTALPETAHLPASSAWVISNTLSIIGRS